MLKTMISLNVLVGQFCIVKFTSSAIYHNNLHYIAVYRDIELTPGLLRSKAII